jgi:hypothetical protein
MNGFILAALLLASNIALGAEKAAPAAPVQAGPVHAQIFKESAPAAQPAPSTALTPAELEEAKAHAPKYVQEVFMSWPWALKVFGWVCGILLTLRALSESAFRAAEKTGVEAFRKMGHVFAAFGHLSMPKAAMKPPKVRP